MDGNSGNDGLFSFKRSFLLILFLFFILPPSALALSEVNIGDAFSTVGDWLQELFGSEMSTFAITIIIFTVLLRSIFALGLKHVRALEGSGGEGLGSIGSTISWTLAILSSIGIYRISAGGDITTYLDNILGPNAMWAAVAIVVFLFVWVRSATGSNRWALFLTSLATIVISAKMVVWPILSSFGMMGLMASIIYGATGFGGFKNRAMGRPTVSTSRANREIRREQKEVEDLKEDIHVDEGKDVLAEHNEEDELETIHHITDLEQRRAAVFSMFNQALQPPNIPRLVDLLKQDIIITQEIIKKDKELSKESETIKQIEEHLRKHDIRDIHKFKEITEKLHDENIENDESKKNKLLSLFKKVEDSRKDITDMAQQIGHHADRKERNDEHFLSIIKEQMKLIDDIGDKGSHSVVANSLITGQQTKHDLLRQKSESMQAIKHFDAKIRPMIASLEEDYAELKRAIDEF